MSAENPYSRPVDTASGELWSRGADFIRGIGTIATVVRAMTMETYHDFIPEKTAQNHIIIDL